MFYCASLMYTTEICFPLVLGGIRHTLGYDRGYPTSSKVMVIAFFGAFVACEYVFCIFINWFFNDYLQILKLNTHFF